jgi:hypothetical protein
MDGRLSRRNTSDRYALEYCTLVSLKVFAADDVQSPTSRKHREQRGTRLMEIVFRVEILQTTTRSNIVRRDL